MNNITIKKGQRIYIEDLRKEIWRPKQLNIVIRELRKKNIINGRKFIGAQRFVPKRNLELFLL